MSCASNATSLLWGEDFSYEVAAGALRHQFGLNFECSQRAPCVIKQWKCEARVKSKFYLSWRPKILQIQVPNLTRATWAISVA